MILKGTHNKEIGL